MSPNLIRIEREHHTAVVFMNRPEKNNAFDTTMFDQLEQATRELEDHLPRTVILTGAGTRAFCAGFDVSLDNPMTSRFLNAVEQKNPDPALDLLQRMRRAVDAFVNLPVPVIAAINGAAYGGGAELAVRCDLRVMDSTAEICFSEVRLGLMPDWGGGPVLAHLVGHSRAADLILTARTVIADEAVRMGLVNRVSDQGRCLEDAVSLAETIGKNGPNAVRHALGILRQSRDDLLQQALEDESHAAARLIASGECIHGITAFMEGKPPKFPDASGYSK
jgi:enoyl-CoA hydratase/carnithine racemase